MNPTHWHLAFNHVPVVGFAGLSILLFVAWFRRSRELTLVALVLLLPVAFSSLPVFLTGDSAKHTVQGLPAVSDRLGEEHEEISRLALAAALASAAASLVVLATARRGNQVPPALVLGMAVACAVSFILMAWTANLGGQIRHSEIRPSPAAPK